MSPQFSLVRLLPGNYRWVICALLFLATTINYMDRQILSLLKPMLDAQLHWTNVEFGYVTAFFQAAYSVGLLGFGWLIDRYGIKWGYAISIAAWSLAAMGHALVFSLGGFMVARIALGLGEGGNYPGAIKTVALWFPRKERAFATSIFNAGSNVGALLAPAFVPLLALTWGWQSPFLVAGMMGFIWLFFWWIWFEIPTRIPELEPSEVAWLDDDKSTAKKTSPLPWIQLFQYPQVWSFLVAKLLTDPIWWFYLVWLPDYFSASRHLNIKESWFLLFTIYAMVTIFSILGSWFTGCLIRRGWSVTLARKTGMFIFAVTVLPVCLTTHVSNWSAVLLIGLAGAAHQAWSANLFTTVSDMFPKESVASVVGLGGMAGSLASIAFPVFTGYLLDSFKDHETTGYAILFTICSLGYLVAFGLNHLLAPKFDPIQLART